MRFLLVLPLLFLSFFARSQGSPCDSVDIVNLSYAPFSDSLIVVTVANHSSELFDYPKFILYKSNGDTVAVETVNFFGIGDTSTHALIIRPNVLDTSDFNGILELWTGFGQTLVCSWPIQVQLCPILPCFTFEVHLDNFGGGMADETFLWAISDTGNTVVATDTMVLDAQSQSATAYPCLPPGDYHIEFTAAQQPQGQVYASVGTTEDGPPGFYKLFQVGTCEGDFTLFSRCFGEQDSIIPPPPDTSGTGIASSLMLPQEIKVISHDGLITLSHEQQPLGDVLVFAVTGQLVLRQQFNASTGSLDLRSLPAGMYIINVASEAGDASFRIVR